MEYIINVPENLFKEEEKIRYANIVNLYFEFISDDEAYAAMNFEDYYELSTDKQVFAYELVTVGYIVDEILDFIGECGEETTYEDFEDEAERIINKYVITNSDPDEIKEESKEESGDKSYDDLFEYDEFIVDEDDDFFPTIGF